MELTELVFRTRDVSKLCVDELVPVGKVVDGHPKPFALPDLRVLVDVPRILLALSRHARHQAERSIAIPHAGVATSLTRFVARRIRQHFVSAYGQPLNDHVATITNVVLVLGKDEQLNEENVRSLAAQNRRSSARGKNPS